MRKGSNTRFVNGGKTRTISVFLLFGLFHDFVAAADNVAFALSRHGRPRIELIGEGSA
jgi:hypothetical protein